METGLSTIQLVAVAALPLLFAITVHEVAHGWMARRLGDPTAMMLGRLTLNPIKHIDPVGTILVPLFLLITAGFVFGWAKPVPVTWENLKKPHRDMALVAAAGPLANLLMALLWALVAKLAMLSLSSETLWIARPLWVMGSIGILMNVVLLVLNLLPIPPLDGSRIVSAFLPGPLAYKYNRLEVYGMVAIVLLLITGLFGRIIGPPVYGLNGLISSLFGL